MSQFPAIKPSSRRFTLGVVPVSTFASMSGKETRVILGDTMYGHAVQVTFSNLKEDVGQQVTDHWAGRQGTALAFTLPSALWAGWTVYTSVVTDSQQWRYKAEPRITAVSPGIMNLSVELVALA